MPASVLPRGCGLAVVRAFRYLGSMFLVFYFFTIAWAWLLTGLIESCNADVLRHIALDLGNAAVIIDLAPLRAAVCGPHGAPGLARLPSE